MLLNIFISLLTSAIFAVAVLLIVRRRLAPQFEEIFRRFAQMRAVLKVLDSVRRDRLVLMDALGRVNRLAIAMTRMQKNTARRLAPLVPLGRELAQATPPRDLTERQMHQLVRHWAPKFGVTPGEEEIRWLLRSLRRMENLWLDDVPADAVDVLARAIAVFGEKSARLRIADAGGAGGLLPLYLRRVGEMFVPEIEVLHAGGTALAPVLGTLRIDPGVYFSRMAASAAGNGAAPKYFESVSQMAGEEAPWDCLLLDAGRLGTWTPAETAALLARVRPGGLVILGGENVAPEAEPLADLAARLSGFSMVACAGETAVLRKLD